MVARLTLAHTDTWPHVQRGGERYLHDLAWYLGHHTDVRPDVVTRRGMPGRDVVEGVPVARTWWLPDHPSPRLLLPQAALAARTARLALRSAAPGLVHAMTPAMATAAAALGVPTVYTALGAPSRAWTTDSPRQWQVVQTAARAADVVTCVGRAAAEGLADLLDREVVALPPGLRPDWFHPAPVASSGPPRILFASAVEPPNKNFRCVVAAFARLLDHHPHATLVVAGPGDVDAMLRACGQAGDRVAPHVERVLPRSEDMPDQYATATVTVLVSYGEAFGLVLAESLACGTPVVASTQGGPAEIVDGAVGVVGTTAPPEDPDGLADALAGAVALAREEPTAARCVAHARRWEWVEHTGPAHLALYRPLGLEARARV